jgi:hypothetical protein
MINKFNEFNRINENRDKKPFDEIIDLTTGRWQGNTYKTNDGVYEVYFDDNYIELIKDEIKSDSSNMDGMVISQFDYPLIGESTKSGDYEVYFEGSYLEFVENGRVITTLYLEDMRMV